MEEHMIQHYNYIVDIKRKELDELLAIVAYRTQELEQLESTLKEKLNFIVG